MMSVTSNQNLATSGPDGFGDYRVLALLPGDLCPECFHAKTRGVERSADQEIKGDREEAEPHRVNLRNVEHLCAE